MLLRRFFFAKLASLLRNLGYQIGFAIKIANLLRKPQFGTRRGVKEKSVNILRNNKKSVIG
jgi:hypothetical protein